MRIVVSDTNCIIHLRKAALLEVICRLPYEIVIPRLLFDHELGDVERRAMLALGLGVVDLDGPDVERAQDYFRSLGRVGFYDCVALVYAEKHADSILLTGDQKLKQAAVSKGVEAHGVLWATDELYRHECCRVEQLQEGLRCLLADPLVFVPDELIIQRQQDYKERK